MAIDLEAIRKRCAELNGQRKNSSVQLWKPTPGEYTVRGLPWPSAKLVDGMPFIERRFYYLGENPRILAPSQFGKPDPVNDLIRKLYSSGTPDDRELAKKLYAKMVAYMPIIVRGQEDAGVQTWSFNKFIYTRLLDFFTNSKINPEQVDYLDPLDGIDLEVTVKKSGKKFNGKEVMDFTIDLGRKQTKLSNDSVKAKAWLDGLPNIDDMYPQKTSAEIEKVLNDWLAGGSADDGNDGAARGDKPKDALDELAAEVKAEIKSPTSASTEKPTRKSKKAVDVDVDAVADVKKKTLDDAMQELMQEESAD